MVNVIAAALPLVLGAVQAGMASRQKPRRPIYEAPSAAKEALANQRRMASMDKAPGTDAMLNQFRQSSAGATQTIKELGGGNPNTAGAVTDLYAKELEALQGMQGNQEAFAINQANQLTQGLGNYAQYEDKAFQYNQDAPFQAKSAAKSALTNAAMSNMMGGVQGALGTYGASKDNDAYMKMLKEIYSNPSPNASAPNVSIPSSMIDMSWKNQ